MNSKIFLLSLDLAVALTPQIIKRLEDQMNFEAQTVQTSDVDYDRIARFMAMECSICKEPFKSFSESHEHYIMNHNRSAYWTCCKLLLETPYDLLDHVKYHESIDVFQ